MTSTNWDNFYINKGRFHLQPHEAFTRTVNIIKSQRGKRVLDLGCGAGRHLVALAQQGFDADGIDISPAAVDLAQKWLKQKGLPGRASIADLHERVKFYKDSSFDAVLAIESIHYKSSAEFIDVLKEIRRLLKTGGILLLVVPSQEKVPSSDNEISFKEESLKLALDRFRVLEFSQDKAKNFVVIAQEK